MYYCLGDGYLWFFNDGVMRREDDFYTREELEDTFVGLKHKIEIIDRELLRINEVLEIHERILQEHTETIAEHTAKIKT